MEIGIIGLPRSGKTTIFNSVTRGNVDVAGYTNKPNIGVAKVPDNRLDTLAKIYHPDRVVPAEITYIDLPAPPDVSNDNRGIGGEYLNILQTVDALMVVARGFEDVAVATMNETIDPCRDLETMLMELIISDLDILDRRITKIDENAKGANPREKELIRDEHKLLVRLKQGLNDGISLRDQGLSSGDIRHISNFGFLSVKPLILVVNINEDDLNDDIDWEIKIGSLASGPHVGFAVISADLEMGLAQLDSQEESQFREALDAGESSLNRMVRISYEVVGQISFFTVGADEVRAWEVRRDTNAQVAAGKIHTDLQRGFIRAEVISWDKLFECGGLNEARKQGLLRHEGKEYVLQDGEIMHVLFNV